MVAEGNGGNDFIFAGDNIDVLYGDNAANTQTGDDFIWAGGGNDYLIGGQGTDTLLGNQGTDFFYGGAGLDYFTLLYDVVAGDADYLLDFTAGVDFVLLPFIASGNVSFGVSGRLCLWLRPDFRQHQLPVPRTRRDRSPAAGGNAVRLTIVSPRIKWRLPFGGRFLCFTI